MYDFFGEFKAVILKAINLRIVEILTEIFKTGRDLTVAYQEARMKFWFYSWDLVVSSVFVIIIDQFKSEFEYIYEIVYLKIYFQD